jgi:flagellar hook assembly protein FlgD
VEESEVNLNIIDAKGRIVKHLLRNKKQSVNNYYVRWDGTNNDNKNVASGVYFAVISAKGFVDSQKIILLK